MLHGSERKSAGMDVTMISERVQRWAGAPTVLVSWWDVLRPAPPTCGDLSRGLLGGDEVVKNKAKVRLEDEEDLEEVSELRPAGRRSATESVDDCRGHGEGEREEGREKINCRKQRVVYIWTGDPGKCHFDEWNPIMQRVANQRGLIRQSVETVRNEDYLPMVGFVILWGVSYAILTVTSRVALVLRHVQLQQESTGPLDQKEHHCDDHCYVVSFPQNPC